MSHRGLRLYLSLSLSPLLIHRLSLAFRETGWWLAEKKASLNPIPNPQQALKNMNGGGPAAAALSRCPVLSVIFSFSCSSGCDRGSGEELVHGKSRKRRSATTVCPDLCALRLGEPSHTANALLLPSLLQLVYGGRYFCLCYYLPDAALLWRLSFLWLCLYPSLPGKGGEVMEVGEAAAAAGDGGLGAHIDLCHFSVSLSRHSTSSPLSLFTSLHIRHTCMHAHT